MPLATTEDTFHAAGRLGVIRSEGMSTASFHSLSEHDSAHETNSHTEIPLVCEPQSTEGGDRTLTIKKRFDRVDVSSSRKGKRKMIDRVGDSIAAGNGGFKRNCTIVPVEEEDSDIEYIGSWRPSKIQSPVESEKVLIKLENLVSCSEASDVSAKFY